MGKQSLQTAASKGNNRHNLQDTDPLPRSTPGLFDSNTRLSILSFPLQAISDCRKQGSELAHSMSKQEHTTSRTYHLALS